MSHLFKACEITWKKNQRNKTLLVENSVFSRKLRCPHHPFSFLFRNKVACGRFGSQIHWMRSKKTREEIIPHQGMNGSFTDYLPKIGAGLWIESSTRLIKQGLGIWQNRREERKTRKIRNRRLGELERMVKRRGKRQKQATSWIGMFMWIQTE